MPIFSYFFLALSNWPKNLGGFLARGLSIVKVEDKGGVLVVWRADLYQKEALWQLSDTSFYANVDKDLTSTNQQIVKSTIIDLIVKQESPPAATHLQLRSQSQGLSCYRPLSSPQGTVR